MTRRVYSNMIMVGGFALLCVAGLVYLALNLGMQVPGQPGYVVKAQFASTNGLVGYSDVRISGVKVGKVTSIGTDSSGAVLVTMGLDPGMQVRSDSRAVIRPKSLLGEKFVELVRKPGSTQPMLQSGGTIPKSNTGAAVEIDDVLNNMDAPTRAAFSETLRELGVALDGQAGNVNESIPEIDRMTANFRPIARVGDHRQQELDRILTDLNTIMQALADEQESLGRVVDSGDTVFNSIDQRNQDLAGTIDNLAIFFGSLDATFADLTPADRASLASAPQTIKDNRTLFSLTNPEVDKLFPELLLAQINYPNDQLSVTDPRAVALSQEWISQFSQRDAKGNQLRITSLTSQKASPSLHVSSPTATPAPAAPQVPGNLHQVFASVFGGNVP